MKNEIIVEKMISYIDKIQRYSDGMSYNDFVNNEMALEACVFNLSQMGELVNKLDGQFRLTNKNVPWHQIYGLRNRIVHDYEGVNFELLWQIIKEDLPELQNLLMNIK